MNTRTITILKDLGYTTETNQGLTVVYKSSMPRLRDAILTKDVLGDASGLKGRFPLRVIEPDLVVRSLIHGGFFRHITQDRFISTSRSLRELIISAHLLSRKIATPEIMGLRFIRSALSYRINVITRLVPGSTDLLDYMETPHNDSLSIFKQSGVIIRKMHDAGVYHADLHIKNILTDKQGCLWILDLDKARKFSVIPSFVRINNLRRFVRSCRKWQASGRIILPDEWKNHLFEGYYNANRP